MRGRSAGWHAAALPLMLLLASPAASGSLPERLAPDHALGADLLRGCGGDDLCIAGRLARAEPGRFRLVHKDRPDTDVIRWVRSKPSIAAARRLADGRLLLSVERFGRTLFSEFRRSIRVGDRLILDLRNHRGGDFHRMLRFAALLGATRGSVVRIRSTGGVREVPLPRPAANPVTVDSVLVGERTASSAEVLAALLLRSGARLCGSRSYGKNWIERVLPVRQGWQLHERMGRLEVPGVRLEGGLRPHLAAADCL